MPFLRIAGGLLVFLACLDIFLTVLYVRSNTGILSPVIGKGGWALFRSSSRFFGRGRRHLLSLAGPSLLLLIAAAWSLLLAFGFALVFWPDLGAALQSSQGLTPTDFLAALYYSGFSLTTLGVGDIVPTAGYARVLTILEAGLGFSFFTLTITYIVSVYGALQRRNVLASILEHKTGGTGNARVYIADLGAAAASGQGGQGLEELAARAADLVESHKFYPVLHYFHFLQNRYALPRMALVLMDTATLLQILPLPGRENLRPALTQLETAGRNLLDHLTASFHSGQSFRDHAPAPETVAGWRRHFDATVQTLAENGVRLPSDLRQEGVRYVRRRGEWHPQIVAFAVSLGYRLEEIMPEDNAGTQR